VIHVKGCCDLCGGPARPDYRTCWRCYVDGERDAAYRAGHAEGRSLGRAEGERLTIERLGKPKVPDRLPAGYVPMDTATWRRLVQLVHPDKHCGSTAAVAAASWLNTVRTKVLS
jgi:hypothetical protein